MKDPKIILGIETSCDETAVSVCQKTDQGVKILSNVVASSAQLQAKFGGVIPEQAAREQLKSIIPVIREAIENCKLKIENLDAIAVTQGPGLVGSLLVGVETAKTLSLIWQKPLVPINHLLGHFYANWICQPLAISNSRLAAKSKQQIANSQQPIFPCIGLLVSGGHTDLILMTGHGQYKYLGGTRDDAAGECFDKCARLLNLPYPGGPIIAKLAKDGDPKSYQLPRPMINSGDLDFSFSGLKTAVSTLINQLTEKPNLSNLCASIQAAIVDVLVKKTLLAAEQSQVSQIIVAGGVAANQSLSEKLKSEGGSKNPHMQIFVPEISLCTDNAAYIATAAFYNFHPIDPLKLQVNPNLSLNKIDKFDI